MSHINYSSNTSESDLNEMSFSLFDSNEEQEISYDEMNESKGEKIFSPEQNVENTQFLKNRQTTAITQESLSPLPLSSTITMTESPSPPLSSLSLQKQLSMPNQLNTHNEMNRKCLTTMKNDRRMAKQMTERKRRDRINALLDNLRTLILKLLHKNPRHHRKLEKADILELVVSFLKKELNHNRLRLKKTTTTSNSSQQICKPMLSVQNTDSSLPTPLIYTDNHYYQNQSLCIPQSNQSTNYYQDFTKYNIDSTKINYPIYDYYIQQNTNTYPLTIPSYYSSYKQPPLQQPLQLSQDTKPITCQPIIFQSVDKQINKENQLPINGNHLQSCMNTITKNVDYYSSCNHKTLENEVIHQPLSTLNKSNFTGQNKCYQSDSKLINGTYHKYQQQSQIPSIPSMQTRIYPDILDSHLNQKQMIIKDENYAKYYSLNCNSTNEPFYDIVYNDNGSNNRSIFTNERTCSTESTNFERLWRPYV